MTMTYKIETGRCILHVEGALTIYEVARDKPVLMEMLQQAADLEIDLHRVDQIDTAGLQLLVLAKREAQRRGKQVRLVAHSPATLEVLDCYNLAAYFGDPIVMPSSAPAHRP